MGLAAPALSLMLLASAGAAAAGSMLPDVDDFRRQRIQKTQDEQGWPFTAHGGTLLCTMIMGKPTVYFIPEPPFDHKRAMLLDVNIFTMLMTNLGMNDELAPFEAHTELISRIAPFVAMGHMLCKQKKGPVVPGNEL